MRTPLPRYNSRSNHLCRAGPFASVGHARLELGPDGNWCGVFLGVRPDRGRYPLMGR